MKLSVPLKNVRKFPPIAPNGSEIYISQLYGKNPQIYQQFGMTGHDGVDFAAPLGTPVLAAHDGYIVECIERDTGYGLRIQIYYEDTDYNWINIYGHFQKVNFPNVTYNLNDRGHFVKEGDVIGYVNSTGFSTGNHLHFGLRQLNKNNQILNYNNGTFGWIDSMPYFKDPSVMETKPVKIYKDNRTVPATIIVGNGVDQEANLKWICSQNGKTLPLKADGSVDYSQLQYDGEINS